MPLLGSAAMLLSFDVAPEAIPEHDDWHSHEHLRERLSIPGFLRGTRWVALRGQPRYLVLYEVADLETLTSGPYLSRLNNPSPWTAKIMPHYRGMRRGFCVVSGSFGLGLGHVAVALHFKPQPGSEGDLRQWLLTEKLPRLPAGPGLGSVHLLEGAVTLAMTNEQMIRSVDSAVDWALIITGFREEALVELTRESLGPRNLQDQGATYATGTTYRLDYYVTCDEVDARPLAP
jgi:hypothetical protein